MRASAIEFRLRMIIQIVIVFLGFWAPWLGQWGLGHRISALEWLPLEASRLDLASFTVATPVVIVLGALAALAGAVLRVWGAAYLGYSTVHHGDMQAGAVMADGPLEWWPCSCTLAWLSSVLLKSQTQSPASPASDRRIHRRWHDGVPVRLHHLHHPRQIRPKIHAQRVSQNLRRSHRLKPCDKHSSP